ncbi:hypothetical protein TrCOL_g1760 [Triparma columacea]|uniref:Uncharacterized protein n=1 Tax=Triparma columacea TaxID=722753 RepID=A0A9W7LAL1_9STRA|nr:hypothetical protein TrCOL_g1760 [Triparma columacea]
MIDDSSMPWGGFFLAAGASNIGQAIMFHYSGIPSLSAATVLGSIGKKVPKPSSPTWATVLLAGGAYCYHGKSINDGKPGLPWGAIATFAALKYAVAAKMYKICTHPAGRPGSLTAFIGVTEVVWGSFFAFWGAKSSGLLK